MAKKVFDWKKTAKKVLVQVIIVGVAGVASVYANHPLWLAIAPLANGVLNVVKHWK